MQNWLVPDLEELKKKAREFQLAKDSDLSGNSIPQKDDVDAYAKSERADSNVATAIRIYSSAISWLPLEVYQVVDTGDKREYIPDPDHEANQLIRKPNPFLSTPELKKFISASIVLTGNSFVLIQKDINTELWPVPSHRVELLWNKGGKEFDGYVIDKNTNNEFKVEYNEMIHIRDMNYNNPFYGQSGIKPIQRLILMDYYAEVYNKTFFKDGCSIAGIFSPEFEITPDQAKQIRKAIDTQHKGYERVGKIFIPPVPGKLGQFSTNHKDIAFGEMSNSNREKIFSVLGIPPSVAGIYRYANYANAQVQEQSLWRHALKPHANLIADGFTRQVMHTLYDDDHVFAFCYDDVEALQQDQEKQANKLRNLVSGGIVTANEARLELGYRESDDPSANELKSGGGMFSMPQDEGEEKTGISRPVLHRDATPPNYKEWKSFDNFLTGKEKRYLKIVKAFFNEQRERVLEKLKAVTANGMMYNSGLLSIHRWAIKDKPPPDDPGGLFDIDDEDIVLSDTITPFIREVIHDSGQKVAADYGFDMVFNVSNPDVQMEIISMINKSKKINETTYSAIKNVLEEAYANEWSLSKVETELTTMFKDFTFSRSEMIARTEMLRAVNGGTMQGYTQAGVEKKEWLASLDGSTRDTHANLDGEQVRVSEPFTRGSVPMRYPGDPSAPPEEVINCRCTLMPVKGVTE